MYSENIRTKVDGLFSEMRTSVLEILDNNTSSNETVELVANSISSITTGASKAMLDDMVAFLTKEQVAKLSSDAEKNIFYRANLRGEILGKYDFTIPNDCIKYDEIPQVKATFWATAGTAVGVGGICGVLIYVLSRIAPPVPVAVIIVSAIVEFLATATVGIVTYKKAVPYFNKKRLKKAVEECLAKLKIDLMNWFDEIEKYFNSRVGELFAS